MAKGIGVWLCVGEEAGAGERGGEQTCKVRSMHKHAWTLQRKRIAAELQIKYHMPMVADSSTRTGRSATAVMEAGYGQRTVWHTSCGQLQAEGSTVELCKGFLQIRTDGLRV